MPTLARILIVEDVATDAELIEREIRRAGIGCATRRVDTEPALREALRSFAPDLVLTDHSMPRLTARETLQLVHQETPDTPVIIVTGSLDEEIAAEYIKAGATDYVVKHHLERLGPAVQRALDLKQAREEQAQAEEARRQGEERFRALIEHGADAIALLSADGTVLFLSHSAEKLFGFAPSELVGRSALELLHPDDAPGCWGCSRTWRHAPAPRSRWSCGCCIGTRRGAPWKRSSSTGWASPPSAPSSSTSATSRSARKRSRRCATPRSSTVHSWRVCGT